MSQINVTITLDEKAYAALKARADEREQSVEEWLSQQLNAAAEQQAWYWSAEWQAAERAAELELDAGLYKDFRTMDELLVDLDEP